MRNNLAFLCGFLILIFGSCKRWDGETVVEGQLIDLHTGKAVGAGKVVVFAADKGYSNGYSVKLEKETDASGNFAFSFEGRGDYLLRGFTSLGYYTSWDEATELKQGRNNKELKVKMRAPAWVKVKLVNKFPLDTVPKIHVQGFNVDQNGQSSLNFYNLNRDTSFIREISGNDIRTITWLFYRIGVHENGSKELFFPSLDTVEIVIPY